MTSENDQINDIVRNVAALEAVRKVRLTLMVFLLAEFFIRNYYRYAITVMVILLWLVIGPFIIGQVLKTDKTKEQSSVLPVFCKKYRYDYKELKAQLITCILCFWCFVVQLYANLNSSMDKVFIIYAPVIYFGILIIGFTSLYFFKRKEMGKMLENNRL